MKLERLAEMAEPYVKMAENLCNMTDEPRELTKEDVGLIVMAFAQDVSNKLHKKPLRYPLMLFAQQQEMRLQEKDQEKTIHWNEVTNATLYTSLFNSLSKFTEAVTPELKQKRLLDVANYAMMIHDNIENTIENNE